MKIPTMAVSEPVAVSSLFPGVHMLTEKICAVLSCKSLLIGVLLFQFGCKGLADFAQAAGEGYGAMTSSRYGNTSQQNYSCDPSCTKHRVWVRNNTSRLITFWAYNRENDQEFQANVAPYSSHLQQWVGRGQWSFKWQKDTDPQARPPKQFFEMSCNQPCLRVICADDDTYVNTCN